MKWLGMHWKEIEELKLIKQKMTVNDKKTLERILEETKDERIRNELMIMKKNEYKVEIQSLNNISYEYLSLYLQKKILKRLYI